MRLLEWLVLLSFLPVLLLPLLPPTHRQRWWGFSAPLPALVATLHCLIEGWRVQMLPFYLLAVLALLCRLPALSRRAATLPHAWTIFLTATAAFGLTLSAVAAAWAMPVLTIPAPTGPYPVGIIDRELVDAARGRRLMVSVWYPAQHTGTPVPLTAYPDQVATALGSLSGLPPLAFQHLRYTRLAASSGVPILPEGGPFPVLVFSHGMVGLRLQNSPTLQELASWGYIVVAVDHPGAAAVTVFPDGEASYYDLASFGITPADGEPTKALMNERVFPVWVADQRFVYDTLQTWAASDTLLAGKLDLDRIASFGHSFGGATALEVCRVDPRCRAAVNLDGGLYGEAATQPAVRPLLLMTSAESAHLPEPVTEWQRLVTASTAPAYWLELPNSNHFSFTITQLLSPLLVPDHFDPRAGLRTVDHYLRLFFDTYLRDTASTSSDCSETGVHWLTQKTLCE